MPLLEKLKDYKILYCEDDETVATIFISIISKFTDNFFYAKNGEEGLELYHKEKPDIIITDVQMPKKNGIEMISEIRKEDEDVLIIITTAYGEQGFLLDAIELNVSKFLLKPINMKPLLNTLNNVLSQLENRKLAEKYREEQEKKKIKETKEEVIFKFLEISVEPIMIVQNNKITNINTLFKKLFTEENLKLLLKDISYFNQLLEKREGFINSLDEVQDENYYENKISIIKPNGKRKIFQIIKKKVYFSGDEIESIVYTFQNITYLEYQKLKIKHYSERLEDFIIKNRYQHHRNEKKSEFLNFTENKEERKFDEEEEKLLRKSHIEKISAQEFLESLDDYIIEDIQELEECEEELDIALVKFEDNPIQEVLDDIILNMEKYARAIKNLQEFDELAEAIYSTINLLRDVELNENNIPKIQKFIENILLDLKSWRKTIFEDANTQDIHYLDSSLFSSCLQFELELKGEEPEEDEGEFEFF